MKNVEQGSFWRSVAKGTIGTILALIIMLGCVGWSFIIWHAFDQVVEWYKLPVAKAALSPGELVDKAMAIPGAIVISPHRNLMDMGISRDFGGAFVGGPSIAVPTKKQWCIWSLGTSAVNTNVPITWFSGAGELIVGSNLGYQAAYDSFTKCVAEGNKVVSVLSQTTTAQWDYKINKSVSAPGLSLTATGGNKGFPLFGGKSCRQGGSLAPGESCILSVCSCFTEADCARCNPHHEEDHSEGIE